MRIIYAHNRSRSTDELRRALLQVNATHLQASTLPNGYQPDIRVCAASGALVLRGFLLKAAYDQLRDLAEKFSKRKYSGSIDSEFNTMKCIDLFHSKELDKLASKLSKSK